MSNNQTMLKGNQLVQAKRLLYLQFIGLKIVVERYQTMGQFHED